MSVETTVRFQAKLEMLRDLEAQFWLRPLKNPSRIDWIALSGMFITTLLPYPLDLEPWNATIDCVLAVATTMSDANTLSLIRATTDWIAMASATGKSGL